jgi:hypothetical protein
VKLCFWLTSQTCQSSVGNGGECQGNYDWEIKRQGQRGVSRYEEDTDSRAAVHAWLRTFPIQIARALHVSLVIGDLQQRHWGTSILVVLLKNKVIISMMKVQGQVFYWLNWQWLC